MADQANSTITHRLMPSREYFAPMTSAFVLTFDAVDGDAGDAYDRVLADMNLGGVLPRGAVFHGAGRWGDGWRVIDVWEDEAAFDAFAQERIGPISARHGFAAPGVERIPLRNVVRGGATAAGYVRIARLKIEETGWDYMQERIGAERNPPAAALLYANGPGATGGWVAVDAWTSRDACRAWIQANVVPHLPEGAGPPPTEGLELHNYLV
jgi:hypothetical protein